MCNQLQVGNGKNKKKCAVTNVVHDHDLIDLCDSSYTTPTAVTPSVVGCTSASVVAQPTLSPKRRKRVLQKMTRTERREVWNADHCWSNDEDWINNLTSSSAVQKDLPKWANGDSTYFKEQMKFSNEFIKYQKPEIEFHKILERKYDRRPEPGLLFTLFEGDWMFPKNKKNQKLLLKECVKECNTVHFIFFSKFQSYWASSGFNPHGIVAFSDLMGVLKLLNSRGKCLPKLCVYESHHSYKDNDFIVINNSSISMGMDWLSIQGHMSSVFSTQHAVGNQMTLTHLMLQILP